MNGPQILRVRGMPAGPVQRNAPVMVRTRLGGLPLPDGTPGNPVDPYDERIMWGGGPQNSAPSAPPPVGAPPATAPVVYNAPSIPYGESDRPWYNPTTYATIPIPPGSDGTVAILTLNHQRNSLIIQNLSTANAPDVAPTLFVGFNAQPQIGQSLALLPGLGFYWGAADTPPRDTIYCLFGPFSNGGGTVLISGVCIQGTYSPPTS